MWSNLWLNIFSIGQAASGPRKIFNSKRGLQPKKFANRCYRSFETSFQKSGGENAWKFIFFTIFLKEILFLKNQGENATQRDVPDEVRLPILSLTVSSSHSQCAVSVLIIADLTRRCWVEPNFWDWPGFEPRTSWLAVQQWKAGST